MPYFRKGNCWSNKTRLEQILTCILITSIILIAILLVLLLLPQDDIKNSEMSCDSPICLKETSKILAQMDQTINPCEDPYAFACGKFLKNSHGDPRLNLLNKAKEKRKHQLLELYSEDIKDDDHRMVKVAKTLFKKCMNETEIEKDNLRTIKDALRTAGGWPVLEGKFWNGKRFNWINATYKLRELGYPYRIFLDLNVDIDRRAILVDLPKYDFEEKTNEFLEVQKMTEIALIFGSSFPRNEIENEIRLTYQFWKTLTHFPFSGTNESQQNQANFNWLTYMKKIAGPKVQISEDDYGLILPEHVYKEYFDFLLKTPKRTLANYMMWRVIKMEIPNLTRSLRNFEKVEKNRVEYCLKILEERFLASPIAIQRDRKYLTEKHRNAVLELMMNIKREFVKRLENAQWIDKDKEKEIVINKAKGIKILVGEYEDYLDDRVFDDMDIDMVKPRGQTFLALLAQLTRNYETSKYHQIKSPTYTNYFDVNEGISHYNKLTNSIIISSMGAMDDFFNVDRPNYLNYAKAAGNAFYGFLTEISGNQEIAKIILENSVNCLRSQTQDTATNDAEAEVHSVVVQTLGEQLSYAAYEAWEKMKGPELKLIGLNYTPRQLYWISSTNCQILDGDAAFKNQQTQKFANLRSRSNNLNFARDFGCPLGTPMNHANKCQLL